MKLKEFESYFRRFIYHIIGTEINIQSRNVFENVYFLLKTGKCNVVIILGCLNLESHGKIPSSVTVFLKSVKRL